jgi:CheY-like chemotaxis protein
VIDDDNDWLVSLEKYLPPVDSVLRATDYHTAVQQLSLQSFDLVVVDLRLVDADDSNFQGMDLIRLIREQDRQRGKFTQIVVVSAFGTPEHIRESYRTFNIYYYFDKRYFSPSKYRDSIAEALR